ncbi:MAG: hypothetical protein WCT49_04800 [Candidatus Paceibacterota bacterium]|jgi:hypothetical protein|nr:hypothetical protein [Candidatus Paceibacterota bacterium]
METFTAPHGDFETIAKMHLKDGHPEEAQKLMESAIRVGRDDDAKKIEGMLGAFQN